MKTIQFILSLMVVGLLASCSADSDVLNEMEEHNQLPNDEYVTVSLDLSAGLTTRATEEEIKKKENEISSYIIKVFGDQGVLLATLTGSDTDVSNKTLNIKKQALKIYAIANFSHEDFADAITTEACEAFLKTPKFGGTPASALPKSGSISVDADDCGKDTHMIELNQLTARINEPTVDPTNSNYTIISMTIGSVELFLKKEDGDNADFPYYVYPNNYDITLLTSNTVTGKNYTFTKQQNNFSANTIYKPVLKGNDPITAGLWIDWYVANMTSEYIDAEVGRTPVGEN